jgi:hypothetical protein
VVASQAQQSAALVEASGVQSAHQAVMNPYQVADIFAQVSMDKQNLQACEEELAFLEQRRLRLIIWTVVCALIGPMLVAQIFPISDSTALMVIYSLLFAGLPFGMSCIHGFFERHGLVLFANWIVMLILVAIYLWIATIVAIPYALHMNKQISDLRDTVSSLQARVESYKKPMAC